MKPEQVYGNMLENKFQPLQYIILVLNHFLMIPDILEIFYMQSAEFLHIYREETHV